MKSKTIFLFLLIVAGALLASYLTYKLIRPNLIREVIGINNHTELVRFYSGKERLRGTEAKKKKYLTAKFDRISFTDDSLAIFFKDDRRGFLSLNSGEVIIDAVYTHAWQFSENLALVTNEKNQIGIISRKGKLKIPFKYNYVPHVADFLDDPVYSFVDGICIITDNNNIGIIDSSGNEKLAPVYEKISLESNGYYSTCKNGKWGLFNSAFSKILDNEFDDVSVLKAGLLVEKDNIESLLSPDGKEVISKNIYSDCYPLQYVSSESESSHNSLESYDESDYESADRANGEKLICKGWTVVKKSQGAGLIRNADHILIIPCIYSDIKAISDKLFRCELDYENYILRDQNGHIIRFN